MPVPAIKICGLSTPAALDAAIAARADYAGFVFYPPSPRHVALPDAAAYARLAPNEQRVYNPVTEISPLHAKYELAPSLADAAGAGGAGWLTHSPRFLLQSSLRL